jgi:DNA modification methylase
MELQGDSTSSPVEYFTHYDSFYFWVFSSLEFESRNLRILDLGGKKIANGILSLRYRVTSLNLAIPIDGITQVKYVLADATKPLPFNDNSFDLFISPVSLNLIGLGRYGDSIDPQAIPHLITELERVTTKKSIMYISIVYGESRVYFNTHIKFRFQDIEQIFRAWRIDDYLIDIGQPDSDLGLPRFTKDALAVEKSLSRNENVIFLKLERVG